MKIRWQRRSTSVNNLKDVREQSLELLKQAGEKSVNATSCTAGGVGGGGGGGGSGCRS